MRYTVRASTVLPAILLLVNLYAGWPCNASGPSAQQSAPDPVTVTIPGRLRSFLRMAAISQKAPPEQVLPLLARNVVMEGYNWTGKTPQRSEYLTLLEGYLEHARALVTLAGPQGVIRVPDCVAVEPLLKVLGYKLRQPCGPDTSLETSNPKKAFLTIDSGFPLTGLEDALRANKPFVYPIASSRAPVLFHPDDWIANDAGKRRQRMRKGPPLPHELVESLVDDPALARLYWAMARMDAGTRQYLQRTVGIQKLIAYAPVLDYYGDAIYIRHGRVIVPGGPAADAGWRRLVGAPPTSPDSFILHLVSKDNGWLAAYYSALSRIPPPKQAYFTGGRRLRYFYEALRGKNPLPGAARSVFRPDPGLVLLVSRLQVEPSGAPHIPGGLAAWKEIMAGQRKSHDRALRLWANRAKGWKHPDQLVAAMFALSRDNAEASPLKLFIILSDIDRHRPPDHLLRSKTVLELAARYPHFGDQYGVFSEFQALNDASITRYFRVADSLDRIRDRSTRADAVGIFQADLGLWQILARQREIPESDWSRSWVRVISPLAHVKNSTELFDATRESLEALVRSADPTAGLSQQEIIDLLAGPPQSSPVAVTVRQDLAYRIGSVMVAQRLVPLETLFALGDGLKQMSHGKPATANLIHLAGDLKELPMPKPLFTNSERAQWTYGLYVDPHLQSEATTDFTKIIRSPVREKKLARARGLLAPFLRDTLVGLNYAYYQPPGAQMLYNDPNFVRSHDFLGDAMTSPDQRWKNPVILGRGWTASGGARLEGSLANLPYVLAEVEQDFIAPRNVQALIWEDMVSTLLTNSVVPRWWGVTPVELHAVALYQAYGDQLVKAASTNGALRRQVMSVLSARMFPAQADQIEDAIRVGKTDAALSQLAPADIFFLAAGFRRRFPSEADEWGAAGSELTALEQRYPKQTAWEKISKDFGVPHPTLADSYASSLLNLKPFPTFLGYSSRLLAESWESNNLYWARLADQMGYSPAALNLLVPQLTRTMIAKIFATDLDDRAALLRALWATGKDFQKSHAAALAESKTASGS